MGQARNANALGGLLQSLQLSISAAQIRALPNSPIPLIGPPAQGFANLIRAMIASLEFGSMPYLAGAGSQAGFFYNGPSRYGIVGGSPYAPSPYVLPNALGSWLGFAITGVAGAVGANTTYTCSGLANLPTNVLAGFSASPQGCSHSANNGAFTVVSNTQATVTINNASGIAEGSPPAAAAMEIGASLSQIGGLGATIDLTPLLTQATGSAVQAWTIGGWTFPTSEISGAGIYLGSPGTGLATPQNFTQGDSSLNLTLEYLQVQL